MRLTHVEHKLVNLFETVAVVDLDSVTLIFFELMAAFPVFLDCRVQNQLNWFFFRPAT